ncbi:MAG TPA: TolC family protein [Spirochaetota bacterium]|nr:TolC family protein [Spirochaetota bacterium]HQO39002.1 TolC family protein [Spirochaetota bacterium]
MRRVIIMLLPVFAAVLLQPALNAQDVKRKLTYNEYMKAVTEKLPELKRNRLQVLKAENNLKSADSSSDINITAGGSYSSSDEYSSMQYGHTNRVTGYSLNAGVSKRFTATGTTLEAGVEHDFRNTESFGNSHYPSVYLQFSQSVLKNSFGVVDRYAVNNATMQLEIEKLKQAESDKTTLNYYKKLYFSWIETAARIELMKESVGYASAIEADTARKYRSGLVPEEDLLNARAAVSQYKISYEELLSVMAGIEAELAVLFEAGTAPESEELDARYGEVSAAGYGEIPFSGTRSAAIYRLARSRLEYTKGVGENRLLPQLDITGRYTRKAMDSEFPGSWSGLDDSDYYIGFTASYPLWNTGESGALKETELAIDEINTEYDVSENSYRKEVEKLKKSRDSVSRMIKLAEERIRLLQSRYDSVSRKYRQGNYQIQQVIDALRDITEEKTRLIRYKNTLIQYHIDYTDLTS